MFALLEEEDGTLWIGTERGLNRFKGIEFETFTEDDGLVHNRVYALLKGSDGRLWLGTEEGLGLLRRRTLLSP